MNRRIGIFTLMIPRLFWGLAFVVLATPFTSHARTSSHHVICKNSLAELNAAIAQEDALPKKAGSGVSDIEISAPAVSQLMKGVSFQQAGSRPGDTLAVTSLPDQQAYCVTVTQYR